MTAKCLGMPLGLQLIPMYLGLMDPRALREAVARQRPKMSQDLQQSMAFGTWIAKFGETATLK